MSVSKRRAEPRAKSLREEFEPDWRAIAKGFGEEFRAQRAKTPNVAARPAAQTEPAARDKEHDVKGPAMTSMSDANSFHVDEVRLVAASPNDRKQGLVGFVSFRLNHGLKIDGVTLRRSEAGMFVLAFPARVDGMGRQHAYVRPLSDGVRCALEGAVFTALGLEEATQ